MKNIIFLISFFLFYTLTFGQYTREEEEESVIETKKEEGIKYTKSFKFKEGAYRTFDEFKRNAPSILFKDKEEAKKEDYYELKKDSNLILYSLNEDLPTGKLSKKNFWGYCKDGKIFVLSHRDFGTKEYVGVDIIGGIFLTSIQRKYNSGHQPQGNSGMPEMSEMPGMSALPELSGPRESVNAKSKLHLIDSKDGNVFDYTPTNFKLILKRDRELYNEFSRIKGNKKQKDMMFIYLKKFNKKHPFYILN